MLSYSQIEEIVNGEIEAAEKYSEKRLTRRKEAWDRYYGKKLGNETTGRSQFITQDTKETIEWMMPFFIRTFASGDSKLSLKIKGQPEWVGQALMEKINDDMLDITPSMFMLFYQWFKDALITDTAVVKPQWLLDIEKVDIELSNITVENLKSLMNDPEVKIKKVVQSNDGDFGIPYFSVDATIDKTLEDTIVADNVPYWEFLSSPDARDINDEHPKGQKTTVTIDYLKRINRARSEDKKSFFKGLDDIEASQEPTQRSAYQKIDSEGKAHTGYDGQPIDAEKYHGRNIKVVDCYEWCTRVDVNEDGFLEDIVCWLVSGPRIKDRKLIRWEKNDEGFIPFCAIKPIIDCYKLYGISWADLVIEIQNLHTMLLRRILYNFDFQNSGRWIIDPEADVDMGSLLENAPGSAIIGKIDGIKEVTPKGYMSAPLQILEYVKKIKEDRTGISDPNRGVPDPLNQTATGMQLIYSASMQRLELIARIFAETGITDLYKKFGMLYQKYLRKPFTTEMFGDSREVTPDMIKGKIIVRVNMGVAANIGMQEAQKVANIVQFLIALNDKFPGLLNYEKIHNISRRYITSMGFRDIDDFTNDIKTYAQEYQQRMEAQQQEKEKMLGLQQKMDEMDRMLKAMEIKSRSATDQARIKYEDVADQRKFVTNKERSDIQKERNEKAFALDAAKAKLTASVALKSKAMEAKNRAKRES